MLWLIASATLAASAPASPGPTHASVEARAETQVLDVLEDDGAPWHDPGLGLDDRMKLANGRPLHRRLMAAMGQLDCGQCGYDCHNYAEALFSGKECHVTVETESELTMGQTVADWWGVTGKAANCHVVTGIDADGYYALIRERLACL